MRYPSVEELIRANADKRMKDMSEDEKLMSEYIRQFSLETAEMLVNKQSVTMFREMPVPAQITCMVQGVMMALAAIVIPTADTRDAEATDNAREFLKINVDIGIENAAITIENAKETLRKMGIKVRGGG